MGQDLPSGKVLPVEHCCASDGQGHHHNQVGEEGEGAEDDVGP